MKGSAREVPADGTLAYYNSHAREYIEASLRCDMSQAALRFEAHLFPGAEILDLGCGAGRDSRRFLDRGFAVTPVDGSEEFCRRTGEYLGIPVRCLRFRELEYDAAFDGIWACASLLHVPKSEIGEVMRKAAKALRSGGAFYASFKYGEGERTDGDGRRFSDYTEKDLPALTAPGLTVTEHWISEDIRPDRAGERWLNVIWRKTL